MARKRVGILCIIGLVCIGLIATWYLTTRDTLSSYVGTWDEIETYQYGELISSHFADVSSFHLEIREDGSWTITDSFDNPPKVTSGQIETYQGANCIYYGDFRYVLDKKGGKLNVDAQYLKGEHAETKLVFQKRK